MISTRIAAATAAAIAIAGSALAAAAPASAATTVTAKTQLSNRADSGGNGNWATDTMTRTLTITRGSGTSYTATVSDSGTFTTTDGAYTPNQGGADLGMRIDEWLQGTLAGKASYSFTASKSPDAALVPKSESGPPASGPQTTSLWYEQAFPAGTVFGGTGITTWGWGYSAQGVTFGGGVGFSLCTEKWSDASTDDGGQDASSGNITGSCPATSFSFGRTRHAAA